MRETAKEGTWKVVAPGMLSALARHRAWLLVRLTLYARQLMVTRRCAQRQFLLRPDTDTNDAFTYCLIEAAQRCQVEVCCRPRSAITIMP